MAVESLVFNVSANVLGAMRGIESFSDSLKKLGRVAAESTAAVTGIGAVLTRQASKYNGEVKRAVENVEGAFTRLSVSVGQSLIPVINRLAEFIADLNRSWHALGPAMQQSIVSFAEFGVKAGLVVGVGGKLFDIIGDLVSVAPMLVSVGLPLLGLATISALVFTAWKKNWGGMRDVVLSFVDTVKPVITQLVNFIGSAFTTALRMLGGQLMGMAGMLSKIGLGAPGSLGATVGEIGKALSTASIGDVFSEITKGVKTAGGLVIEAFEFTAEEIKAALKDKVGPAWDAIAGIFGKKQGSGGGAGFSLADQTRASERARAAANAAVAKEAEAFSRSLKMAAEQTERFRIQAIERRVMQKHGSLEGNIGYTAASTVGGSERLSKLAERMGLDFDSIANTVTHVARNFIAKMGNAGEIMSAAFEGFQSGGVWGAVIAAVFQLLTYAEDFTKWIDQLNANTKVVANVFNGIFNGLQKMTAAISIVDQALMTIIEPIINLLADAAIKAGAAILPLANVFKALGGIVSALAKIVEADKLSFWLLANVLKAVATVLLLVVGGIAKVVQLIAQAVAWVLGVVAGVLETIKVDARWLREFQHNIVMGIVQPLGNTVNDAINSIGDMWKQSAQDQIDFVTNLPDPPTDGTKRLNEFIEALTNTPSGFKVNAARFASAESTGVSQAAPIGLTAGAQQITIQIQSDMGALMGQVSAWMQNKSFATTGTPVAAGIAATGSF